MVQLTILVVHLTLAAIYSVSLIYNILYVTKEGQTFLTYDGYAGKLKYLTFWNFCLQAFYFGLCVINDIIGTNAGPGQEQKRKSKLQAFIDKFLASIGFPMGIFVVITFWAIYYVDRELVFPKSLDGVIPPWLNHIMHTVPMPFLLLEKYMVYHEYPVRGKGMLTTIGFASIYQVWILWIAYHTNFWVYPILEVLNNAQRAMFFLTLWAFLISIYLLGEGLTRFWWRYEKARAVHKTSSSSKRR